MGDSTTIALNLTFFGTLGLALLMFLGLFLLVVITLLLAGAGRLFVLTVMALFGRLPKHETLPLIRLTGESVPPSGAPVETHDDGAAAPSAGQPARAGVLRSKAGALRTTTGAALSTMFAHGAAAVAAVSAPRNWRKALQDARTFLKPSELRPRFHHAAEHHPLLTAARKEPPMLAEDWAAAVAEADARAMARARAAAPEIKISVRDLPGPSVPAAKVEAVAPLVESALHQDNPARDNSNRDPSRESAGLGAARSFTKPPAPAPLSVLDTGSLVSLSGHANVLKAKLPADRS
ncbi:hypothetical protein AU252_11185 [Pseudarthrobacter sulfonivorans]|uniref:Uncharacterized protein n=1 Tax=Pseudarthrobacter sulfonivorans TaxID=121292 RepID=A0A0U3NXQ9_9MICC|nr:hypothetical protein [Pseudarthrobacter sulfonivorans]ALV41647.1 hypothetical protein AU252_11185 [Pseudarthrobacter sulfonivorans]